MKKAVITVALSVLLALLSANVNTVAHAQGDLVAPSNVTAQHTGNPGEVRISWDAVPNAEYYRIGWVAYSDVEPIIASGGDWLEHFAFIDIENPRPDRTLHHAAHARGSVRVHHGEQRRTLRHTPMAVISWLGVPEAERSSRDSRIAWVNGDQSHLGSGARSGVLPHRMGGIRGRRTHNRQRR